jgi:hypothetical protein
MSTNTLTTLVPTIIEFMLVMMFMKIMMGMMTNEPKGAIATASNKVGSYAYTGGKYIGKGIKKASEYVSSYV